MARELLNTDYKPGDSPLRAKLYHIIFESEPGPGRRFDVVLIICILLSVAAVMMESVGRFEKRFSFELAALEWGFTILFTIEYFLRIYSLKHPRQYISSFFGIVDFVSIVPTYLGLFLPGGHYLLVVRTLRLLRVFRVLKLAAYTTQATVLMRAIVASREKIIVFLVCVLSIVLIVGAMMHLVEGPETGFTSIPKSVYWAVVTLTTVGYGDIAPQSGLGQLLAAMVMIMGYGVIAVPTGIVTVELGKAARRATEPRECERCGLADHEADARFCRRCGEAFTSS